MESLEKLEQHTLFSVILNNAFDAIVCYTPVKNEQGEITDFRFIYLNDSAFKILSGVRENYIGRTFLELFPGALYDGMFDAFKHTEETGNAFEDIFYYEYGEYKGWYRNSIIKYQNGLIVFFRDVSHQKALELELQAEKEKLEQILKDKEILLKEVHHRVKNNLQIISSLMRLQGLSIDDKTLQDSCLNCQRRISSMALIHHDLYKHNDLESINLSSFITESIKIHQSLYNGKTVNIRYYQVIEAVHLDLSTFVNIALIITELLTNSIKHAFTGRKDGEIRISITPQNGNVIIRFSDNGIGITPLPDLNTIPTLGLTLVNSIVEQLNGKIEIENSGGTICSIVFPTAFVDQETDNAPSETTAQN